MGERTKKGLESQRVKTSCAGQIEMRAEGPQRSEVGVDGMVRERARLMHGTQTRGRGEIRVGDVGLGVLPLTVSLEDLRLLKLEARVEVIALNVAFFLGSGSALPLFLS